MRDDEHGDAEDRAQEVRAQDVRGWPGRDDTAARQEHDPIGVGGREVEVVEDGQHATTGLRLAAQQAHGQVLMGRIQAGGGLVEQQVALGGSG